MSNDTNDMLVDESVLVGEETDAELALTTNIYTEIRKRLALHGVPMDQVAFIHDAKTPESRAKLFAAVNRGEIRVLLGSTEKMGTGMNVQERCVAMHTLTPPWRPGDIEQQVGRVLRQGNLFPQVCQFVHVTEGSFDAYVWQLLENKAGFIGQIATGQVSGREVEDVDETVLSFSEIKALASGNPQVMQKIVLDAELARLSAIRASWLSSQANTRASVRGLELRKAESEARLPLYRNAVQKREVGTAEKFSILLKPTIDAETLEIEPDREQAGRKVRILAEHAALRLAGRQRTETFLEIGTYRGFAVCVTVSTVDDQSRPIPQLFFRVGNEILLVSLNTDTGVTQSMDIRLKSLDEMLRQEEERIRVTETKIEAAQAEANRPWDHEKKFIETESKVRELDALLNKDAETSQQPPAPVPTPDFARRAIARKNDTAGEVRDAIAAIRAMLADPGIVARFAGENDILTVAGLDELEHEIETKQALFTLGAAIVQLDLFGGSVAADAIAPRRRRH